MSGYTIDQPNQTQTISAWNHSDRSREQNFASKFTFESFAGNNKEMIQYFVKGENRPIPSRTDKFGLMISSEFTKKMSPMYKWFVGT